VSTAVDSASGHPDDPGIAAYLRHLQQERQVSVRTLDAYQRDLVALLDFLVGAVPDSADDSGIDWPRVTAAQIRLFVAAEHHRGLGPRSLQRRLSAVRGLFNHLLREGKVDGNPALGIRAPKTARKLPDVLDVDRTAGLLDMGADDGVDSLDLRDHAMFELLYGAGLRLAELVGLDLERLDLDQGLVRVLGKGARERVVPIGRHAAEAIAAWLEVRAQMVRAGEAALFVGQGGTRLGRRSVQVRLRRWALQRGLPTVHPHTLRHCFASHLLESSGDLRAVQELLGHANLATTQVYTHLDFQHLAKVYDRAHPRARRGK
jgi:integrase/recombinase XerC